MKSDDYGLTWIVSPLSHKVDSMDLTLRIDGASITTTVYEKPSNFHLYIPPHSCHPPGLLRGMVYGMLYRIYTLCSDQYDRQVRTTAFYHHLKRRGYESKALRPLFHLAITKVKARETKPSPAPANQADVRTYQFFHLEYHPLNPPSRDFQAAWTNYVASPPNIAPIEEHSNVTQMSVAFHRPPNLSNLLSYRMLRPHSGPSVSSYFD
jgi:hypothetical protein